MGALKGRFQCLRGLRVSINSKQDHHDACRRITIAIILHDLIIDVEGSKSAGHFAQDHGHAEEYIDRGQGDAPLEGEDVENVEAKRKELVTKLLAFSEM